MAKLEETLDFFKDLWKRFIEFLKDKFFSSSKYDDIINELYNEEIIYDNNLDIIQNKDNNKSYDDFER